MFWTAVLFIAPTLLFAKTAIDYVYPGQLKLFVMKTGWNVMEACSRMEIVATNFYNQYIPTFRTNKAKQSMIKFISDGDEAFTCTYDDFKNKKYDIKINYDFIFHEIPIVKKDKYENYDNYLMRYESVGDIITLEYTSLKCFELNMVQITINDSCTKPIDLGRNQCIINGNILFDRPFLKWYLNNYDNSSLEDEDTYTITFIDHNMNYITLPDSCYLIIRKNNYDIVNIVKEE
jgi:hypothetical protein